MEIVSSEVAKAKEFWRTVDIDHMFNKLSGYLNKLREMIKTDTASDREYVWSMTMVLESEISLCADGEIDSIEEVLIDSDVVLAAATQMNHELPSLEKELTHEWEMDGPTLGQSSRKQKDQSSQSDTHTIPFQLSSPDAPSSPAVQQNTDSPSACLPALPADELLLEPLPSLQMSFQVHDCSPSCLPCLPLSADDFLGQNPLEVPLLCQFQRLFTTPLQMEPVRQNILYKAPCGRGLRGPDEVLRFLRETGSDGILRLENFSFNSDVEVIQACDSLSVSLLEKDISKKAELTSVQLCNEVDGTKPKEFRYRKDRWPHGCFVGPTPLFSAYCDCSDGCTDGDGCACLQLSLRAMQTDAQCHSPRPELYIHKRLPHPVPTGIYECGPWCGCDRTRCQNRLVQGGLRVRLQVFCTHAGHWGVRCLDDLDQGTFICTYAGVLLRAVSTSHGAPPLKRKKEELPSDDEVEVVEEWKVPPEETGELLDPENAPEPVSPTSVIKGPMDRSLLLLEENLDQAAHKTFLGSENESRSCSKKEQAEMVTATDMPCYMDVRHGEDEADQGKGLWEKLEEHLYYLDATEEGNVARFFSRSCRPNLFVQNVFCESHDPQYPTVAFFTSRPVKAGTELTWNFSREPGSVPEKDV